MKLYVATPVLDEEDRIGDLVESLRGQTESNFEAWFCVNQPDSWWEDASTRSICEANQRTISYLKTCIESGELTGCVLDYSSVGSGFPESKRGVGWARKVMMDQISDAASPDDVIVSMDADTVFDPGYLDIIRNAFSGSPDCVGVVSRFSHQRSGDELLDRAVDRYEAYLNAYESEMQRVGSIFAYTPLGSAFSVRVSAYRAIGGMVTRPHTEDFYFLQNLRKHGRIGKCNGLVRPAARLSDRVAVGTGPALKLGMSGDWSRFPFFDPSLFDLVRDTIALFPILYERDVDTPMDEFLKRVFKTEDVWGSMRRHSKDQAHFVHQCHCRVDGLRIWQFLRSQTRA